MRKLIIIFCIFIFVVFSISFTTSQINYNQNVIAEQTFIDFEDGYINNQSSTSVFNYGFCKSYNKGCGWIATYNVCKYLNLNVTISDTIRAFDFYGTNLYAVLGTNPFAIIWFLNAQKINANISFDVEKFDELAQNSTVCILGYSNLKNGHYQMFVKATECDYTFYNPLQTHTMASKLSTIDDAFKILIYIK
ncbi:MAG: hypothetical protein WC942_07705 [Clostridia bacterium]|jgi:hypothetical protein